jgi:hypothetical protein
VIISISWAKRIISPSIQKANDPILNQKGLSSKFLSKLSQSYVNLKEKFSIEFLYGEGQLLVKPVTLKVGWILALHYLLIIRAFSEERGILLCGLSQLSVVSCNLLS